MSYPVPAPGETWTFRQVDRPGLLLVDVIEFDRDRDLVHFVYRKSGNPGALPLNRFVQHYAPNTPTPTDPEV